jgi:hypothetical protein
MIVRHEGRFLQQEPAFFMRITQKYQKGVCNGFVK